MDDKAACMTLQVQQQARSDKQIGRVLNLAGPAAVITAFSTLSQSVQLQEGQVITLASNTSQDLAAASKPPQEDSPTAHNPIVVHCANVAAVLMSAQELNIIGSSVQLEVTIKEAAKQQAQVKVLTAGVLTVGLHILDDAVLTPEGIGAELTTADAKAVHEFVSRHFVEYVAAPVSSLADVASLRQALDSAEGSAIEILARIEDVKALPDLDKLLQQVAGVYICRQGLPSHLQPHELPQLQKLLISRAKLAGRLAFCSADLLITSHGQAKAAPAEVADVTNAVLDGCDCVVLSTQQARIPDASTRHLLSSDSNSSWCTHDGVEEGKTEGETVIRKSGTHARPNHTLKAAMLATSSVLQSTDEALNASAMLTYLKEQAAKPLPAVYTAAISAVSTALDCHACLLITVSNSPRLPLAIAVGRPPVPQMLVTDSKATARLCSPAFGVYDLLVDDLHDTSGLIAQARVVAQEAGLWNGRDAVVIVREDSAGVPLISIQS